MRIDFIFDTVCPWCYVGKRRFQRALALRPDSRAQIRWRPFLLNPDIPPEGLDRSTYLDRKFGGPSRVSRIHHAVAAAGRVEGIEFDFDAITRTPNTLNSHRMIRFAARIGREAATVEALYAAYFSHGRDIGLIDTLVDVGVEIGLPADPLLDYLLSDSDISHVMGENSRAHRLGVNGVPSIILDDTYALAGAQEPDVLLRLIDIAREAQAEATLS